MYKPVFNSRLKSNTNSIWFSDDCNQYSKMLIIENKFRDILERNEFSGFYVLEASFDFSISHKENLCTINYICSKHNRKMPKKLVGDHLLMFSKQQMNKLGIKDVVINFNIAPKPFVYAAHLVKYMVSFMQRNYITARKMQKIISYCISDGAVGCILGIKGRINGREMSRKDSVKTGLIRRNTYSNDLSFHQANYYGKSGCVGVKAWINRGPLDAKTNKKKKTILNKNN